MQTLSSNLRVAWVIGSLQAGGIAPVCRYAAEGVARLAGWKVSLVSIDDRPHDQTDELTRLRSISLGNPPNASRSFLGWLAKNPHDIVITSDVSGIESAFPYFPRETLHIIQIHDSHRRAVDVSIRNHRWVDGVVCVAQHITLPLAKRFHKLHFKGRLETIHNGATFPPISQRTQHGGPLKLLYTGSMDPFKGIFDLVPILYKSKMMGIPAELTIVGGHNEVLERRFKKLQLASHVSWAGRISHADCYSQASQHDIFLLPSRKEAFGMVTIEAMAMGCVPLAYDVNSGNREIIEHGKSGLLLPLGDFNEWANTIHHLHHNREFLQTLSLGSVHRSRTHFTSDRMASHLCTFIDELKVWAQTHRSERISGIPETVCPNKSAHSYYLFTPQKLRKWLRRKIGESPRLCHFLLDRW